MRPQLSGGADLMMLEMKQSPRARAALDTISGNTLISLYVLLFMQ